jgi:hypothetical protein
MSDDMSIIQKFHLGKKRKAEGSLGTVIIVILVLVVLGFFGWFGLHL